ncbi:carbamoyltransferase HypF [Helicobacter sp.]|uniref:carbamoyltransferase HypF n=1 Tax=Helicobacter sp. TaxID=218 RepID=UPI0019CF1778|nr:carbamoyltransferase HypF [Helicobacter sp.]MBD5164929.1 carbamoyltransferase HypF [Helicobacter sp.]
MPKTKAQQLKISSSPSPLTYEFRLQGVVQGVGFRPFVYRIATQHHIQGFVHNDTQGVFILAQGDKKDLEAFAKDLQNPPSAAKITHFTQNLVPTHTLYQDFTIQQSKQNSPLSATIPADIALCQDCLKELFDTSNRRFSYAFISCTNCGARYSLISNLPYDRQNTAMGKFKMCQECQSEYDNPNSRRFHSEINCCQVCGPKLFYANNLKDIKIPDISLTNIPDSEVCDILESQDTHLILNPLEKAIEDLKNGKILAIKGVGGYALVCNALNSQSILNLRERKHRPRKPFAILCKNLAMAEHYAHLNPDEKTILNSPLAPILLAKAKSNEEKSTSAQDSALPLHLIAPNLDTLGIILPYTALHYLLTYALDFPLIFTSANLSGEPIIKDFGAIIEKLGEVCDGVLFFNRDIFNAIDDSLVRKHSKNQNHSLENMQVLRRARGFLCNVALPTTPDTKQQSFIGLGAQQKATFCLHFRNQTLLSPHLGDLDNLASFNNFISTKQLFCTQYQTNFNTLVLDLHPNYTQRNLIEKTTETHFVQHHFAHLLSNIAENSIDCEVLGVIFDGTGYGEDGTIWGGEFLKWNPERPLEFSRLAHFDNFALLGGEKAIKDIRRLGLEVLFGAFEEDYSKLNLPLLESLKQEFGDSILETFYKIHKSEGKILCDSVGRLFDAVSALCGVCLRTDYEGEGGMILESLATKGKTSKAYSFEIQNNIVLWKFLIREIYQDLQNSISLPQIALNFHYTLAQIISTMAQDFTCIALSGGCFQNALLTRLTLESLQNKQVYLQHQIPCNDGGISFGQAYYLQLKNKN